ncbi:MAG: DUF503 domain-containing protein [Chloroflexota bacterium]|nr:DUF503 domain-containing protein [Chloroflexota bacterium]
MHIGALRIRLRLPENSSLKGKRKLVKSITDRVGNKFNVSIAEVDDHDRWQVATLGVVCVSNDGRHTNEVLSRIIDFIGIAKADAEMLDYEIEIISAF